MRITIDLSLFQGDETVLQAEQAPPQLLVVAARIFEIPNVMDRSLAV